MKRTLSLLLAVLLVFVSIPFAASATAVITVSTPAQFLAIRNDLTKNYQLSCNIAFTEDDYKAGGILENGFLPFGLTLVHNTDIERPDKGDEYVITPFTGTLDGNGHYIAGLKIEVASTTALPCNYAGIVAWNEGTVKNLIFAGNITFNSTESNMLNTYLVGSFAAYNTGTVQNCANVGKVYAKAGATTNAGGIVGQNNGTVKDCYNSGIITCGNEKNNMRLGGIAGYTSSTSVLEHCFTVGPVMSENVFAAKSLYVGDLIGYNNGVINSCYALQYNSKILGRDSATAAVRSSNVLAALTSEQANLNASFVGFDFTELWTMTANAPELKILYHAHNYGSWTTVDSNSCQKKGYRYRICANCGKIDTEYLAVGPHTGEWKVIKQPTLLHTGTEQQICTGCGTVLDTHTLAKLPRKKDAAVFQDVSKKQWFYEAVDYAYNAGLFGGISATKFAPNDNMTRGMFVTVLGRLYGVSVNHNITTKFTDVKKGQWYTGYVKWASDKGIVSGMSATTFAPNANVTREQICKMMIEYCNFAKIKLKSTAPAIAFADAGKISSWARLYVKQCQTSGLVGGTVKGGKTYFNPKGNATRAEVAKILYNFSYNYL